MIGVGDVLAVRTTGCAPQLWSNDWHGQGPPGHVVCSSYAAWLYIHVGLDAPSGQRSVTPADWTDFSLTHRYDT